MLLVLAIDGDLRFISHRDTMRMLERAVVRAALPVAYTRGFNPHLKLSLPLPRPVGMASDGDPLVLDLSAVRPPAAIRDAVAGQLPAGAALTNDAIDLQNHKPQLLAVHYEVPLPEHEPAALSAACRTLLDAATFVIERHDEAGAPKAALDIRPFVARLAVSDGRLHIETRFHEARTVAPKDLLPALGLPWEALRHRVRRRKVLWQ